MPTPTASYETVQRGDVKLAVITLQNPPVNQLSHGVREGLQAGMAKVRADPLVKGVVLQGSNDTFCAGADISEFSSGLKGMFSCLLRGEEDFFSSCWQGPSLPELIFELESLQVPVVASIANFALGGGLELALGAHYRVCEAKAKLGLPEVNLGLLPGAGGTQRLPRITGIPFALKVIVGGVPVSSDVALKAKLVDHVAPKGSSLLEESLQFLVSKVSYCSLSVAH